ncbi:MAG: DUF885 domain-containing protein [Pseudomonadota bacterium]
MRKLLLLALLGTTALAACSGEGASDRREAARAAAAKAATPENIAAETERLSQWFKVKWQEELDFSPMFKTYLGIKEDYDKIDDMTEGTAARQLAWRRAAVAEMKEQFDYRLLSDDAKLWYDAYAYELEQQERSEPFGRRGYVMHQMYGPHADLPNFLINFHRVETVDDMEAYIARLSGVARALGQALDRVQINAAEGVHAPKFAYEAVIEQSRALITGAPFDPVAEAPTPSKNEEESEEEAEAEAVAEAVSEPAPSPLLADVNAKLATLVETETIDEAQADELRGRAVAALLDHIKPAYEAIITWVEADMANSPDVATGVGILPDGEAFYTERLAYASTTNMTPDQVHQIGLDEVARIRAEMEAIKEQVEFDGTLEEFFKFVREDDQFYYDNTDEGREAYLEAARMHLAAMNEKLPEAFGILPKAELIVKRVEAFRERDGAAQHYFTGTPDGSRPGIFYAHLSDMKAMPIPQLEVIAYHEGNPGHHMQLSIAQEMESLPDFRGQAGFTAFVEGWALYSELLSKELGAYEDPYSDFGRLTTEIWRAIRLVVDTGLHSKGWTEQEAIDYFTANSPAAAGQIKSEVQRYIVLPGQATAYKIGMLKIVELRARAEEELGENFDIKAFHDLVLGGGALPMDLLEKRVDEWIASNQKAS